MTVLYQIINLPSHPGVLLLFGTRYSNGLTFLLPKLRVAAEHYRQTEPKRPALCYVRGTLLLLWQHNQFHSTSSAGFAHFLALQVLNPRLDEFFR